MRPRARLPSTIWSGKSRAFSYSSRQTTRHDYKSTRVGCRFHRYERHGTVSADANPNSVSEWNDWLCCGALEVGADGESNEQDRHNDVQGNHDAEVRRL